MLKENRYFIESSHVEVIQKLLNDPVIQSCKISEATEASFEAKQGLNYVAPIHGDDGRLADGGVAPEYRYGLHARRQKFLNFKFIPFH